MTWRDLLIIALLPPACATYAIAGMWLYGWWQRRKVAR